MFMEEWNSGGVEMDVPTIGGVGMEVPAISGVRGGHILRMWKLKIAEGGDEEWLTTTNNHVGRQHWEFDTDAGTEEERAHIEKIRNEFKMNRFKFEQSADLLMRMQNVPEDVFSNSYASDDEEDRESSLLLGSIFSTGMMAEESS
ncbi:hypothetical protein L1987_21224 [Smallanthus sonchifolius]|uniref:Uncharacterized protein n=1 Tax=Smallanthus sonchifolius TaxID=185202 RepID=A0ACB9IU16_9ASTR|nr:hypothetical protein L1987_21224 [Smallanthus sonchifolius]